jgi:hypothetical protein
MADVVFKRDCKIKAGFNLQTRT